MENIKWQLAKLGAGGGAGRQRTCGTENDIIRDGLSATVQCWKRRSRHSGMSVATNRLQGPARSVLAFSVLNLVLKSKLSL